MSFTLREIESQPETWRVVLRDLQAQQETLLQAINHLQFSRIVVTGCGSTYYLSLFAAQLLRLYSGFEIQALPASEAWLLPALFPVDDTLLLAISRSGTTTETIRAGEAFRAGGGRAMAVITCDAETPLAALADVVLEAAIAQEQSVVQTRSFTSMTLLAAGFAYLLGQRRDRLAAMQNLPEELTRLCDRHHNLPVAWSDLTVYNKTFFLGSGPAYGLVCEAMLKVKEMSTGWVEAFHTLEFRHGPMSLISEGALVVAFVSDAMRQAELDVLRDVQQLGAQIVLCDDGKSDLSQWRPEFHISVDPGIDQWLRGVLFLPLMQRMGYFRALESGLNPDQPINLRQVIEI